ncbi:hypothetical protein [Bacillus cereus]|uniref:hypothetical protein n=1 Tax=Bacillus cereus TaxID=1396 RepID=UPI0018F6EC5B|nr:hypothetical protein [Bacillus cereus]
MKKLDHIEKCMCEGCKKFNGLYSIYSVNSKGRMTVQRIMSDRTKAIEALKGYHDNGHLDICLIEGKLVCEHRVSNREIDYVVEQIMNKSYLFEPPCGIRDGCKYSTSYPSLYDVEKQKCISSSDHSQSQKRTLVPCQRCDHGSQYVYLNRVYERMVKRGVIEQYPVVDNNGYMNI